MQIIELSQTEARAVMLAAQGLHRRPRAAAKKRDVLLAIRRMGALQIDTIHVVARSPYLVLWSRLGDYEPRWLDELLEEGKLFEYWSHEACFLPIEDYALYRHRMLNAETLGWKYRKQWVEAHRKEIDWLKDFIEKHGAVRAADFERKDGKAGGWWEWKTEKRALETLFTAGELMIARRRNFHRVYDLRQRVLPGWDDSRLPSAEDVRLELALKAVRALGVARARWVADYFRTSMRETLAAVRALAENGALLPVEVEGWKEQGFLHPGNLKLLKAARDGSLKPELTTLLSPFDPLVWDRARARQMFDFDYRLECYTPAPRRRYGYFTLPVLHRDRLIGRLDAKAHRAEAVFEVKSLHMQPHVKTDDELVTHTARALKDCAAWHKTPKVKVSRTNPTKLASAIRHALKQC